MIKMTRETSETQIELELEIYGSGNYDINTGIGFFDHMLELWAKHGFFDLKLRVEGDLEVDQHHTVEDTGILLGQAVSKVLGARVGIKRYGDIILPMDETLVMAAIDLGGRPYYDSDLVFTRTEVGGFPVELFDEFFRSFSNNGGFNIHFKKLKAGNTHHLLEACFKSAGKILDQAVKKEERLVNTPMSTKGRLQEGGRH